MIEFNLEAALAGKPVITRDGREVSEIHYFKTATSFSIACIVDNCVKTFTTNGSYYNNDETSGFDLFMKPEIRTYWANVYINRYNNITFGNKKPYDSEEKAKNNLWKEAKYIKTISFTVEV